MPIYEYEPDDRECLMCEGRVEVLQAIDENPLRYCPYCGLEVRRVISKASIRVDKTPSAEVAAKKGFTTFRRAGRGVWEKVAGPGEEGAPKGDKAVDVDDLDE